MTAVLVRLTTPSSGAAASGWVPADEVAAVGHLECRPYAPDADGARLHLEAPDRLLLPASMPPVRLVAGEAVLHLAPTGVGWCWQIIERTPRGITRYVLVPDSAATLDYAPLVDVDPTTLAATAAAVPAWEAAVSAVESYAQAAADSAALAASEADSVEQTIAAEVQDWLAANPPAAGDDGREVEFGLSATHVQWRYVGDAAWTDLIALLSLVGATGATPELQATATHLQWREPGGVWADLVALADLRGPQGDPGPSAYEVAVAAGFVGSEAAWLASLKGDEGDAAPLPTITATANTGEPGTAAAASVSGTYPDLSLDLTIPEGKQGDPGPSNELAIGTVTTGAVGSLASATITGDAPSQMLNLTIPRGDAGAGGGAPIVSLWVAGVASANGPSAPSSAALNTAADLDIRVKAALTDWTPSGTRVLAAKWATTGDRSWRFVVASSGYLALEWYDSGGTQREFKEWGAITGITDGTAYWVRVTLDADNGAGGATACFYKSADGATWTQVGPGKTVTGAAVVKSSTAPLSISWSDIDYPFEATVLHAFEMRTTIDGAVVAAWDGSFPHTRQIDTAGNVWTVNGTANAWKKVGA